MMDEAELNIDRTILEEDEYEDEIHQRILSTPSLAYDNRERFADWCVNEGDVDFQYKMI